MTDSDEALAKQILLLISVLRKGLDKPGQAMNLDFIESNIKELIGSE